MQPTAAAFLITSAGFQRKLPSYSGLAAEFAITH